MKVFWKVEEQWFSGVIVAYNDRKKDYQIQYDDEQIGWKHLLENMTFLEGTH